MVVVRPVRASIRAFITIAVVLLALAVVLLLAARRMLRRLFGSRQAVDSGGP